MSTFFVQVVVSTVIEYLVEADNTDDALEKGRKVFNEEGWEAYAEEMIPQEIRVVGQTEWESF